MYIRTTIVIVIIIIIIISCFYYYPGLEPTLSHIYIYVSSPIMYYYRIVCIVYDSVSFEPMLSIAVQYVDICVRIYIYIYIYIYMYYLFICTHYVYLIIVVQALLCLCFVPITSGRCTSIYPSHFGSKLDPGGRKAPGSSQMLALRGAVAARPGLGHGAGG